MLEEKLIENIQELLDESKLKKSIKDAFSELKYQKSNKSQYFMSISLSIIFGSITGFSQQTINVVKIAAELFNTVDIAFIAMIIGAYSVFQALLTDEFLIALVKTENNLLKVSNKSFVNLVMLYLFAIIINILILLVGSTIKEDWTMTTNMRLNNSLAISLCSVYFFYNLMIILEMKNFANNLYRMFNASNSNRIIDIISKDE